MMKEMGAPRTKSGIMLGLGETEDEILTTLSDMRSVGVDIVTIGQYLQPTRNHLPVREYVAPEMFVRYKERPCRWVSVSCRAARWCVPRTMPPTMYNQEIKPRKR